MTAAARIAARALAVAAVVAVVVASGPVRAQSMNLGAGDGTPIEIFSDNGIEWQQDNLVFLAKGNAKAVRGDVTVLADQLAAFYTERPDGTTEIYRLDADGSVKITSPDQIASGDKAVYDVTREILVLSGGKPNMVTPDTVITATQQLEYWERRQMAIARGKAEATKDKRRIRADVLAAFFRKAETGGNNKVYRVDAYDNVSVLTERDRAYGDRGVYNVETGIVTLTGSVRIERDKNELKGCRAEVNLNTEISRLFSCPGGQTKGTLRPGNKGKSGE